MGYCEIKFTYPYLENRILKSIRKDEPENWDDYFLKPSLPYSKKEIIINRNDIEFIFSESLHLLILP